MAEITKDVEKLAKQAEDCFLHLAEYFSEQKIEPLEAIAVLACALQLLADSIKDVAEENADGVNTEAPKVDQ